MPTTFDQIQAAIETTMLADRHRMRRRLARLQQAARQGQSVRGPLQQLAERVADSVERRHAREQSVPNIDFDLPLPILERRTDIEEAIRHHQVVIVCGDTGSGKSTQLPKICLAMGRGVEGLIGHTQPRRLAARTIATRVAEELHSGLGHYVGYKVRFTDSTQPNTLVKLMTDGILLAETASDRFLNQYDTIILDEAHERSLNIDFLVGYLKRLLPQRPELRCIITSATLDPVRLSEHFAAAETSVPIIEVSGRTYPVELRYRPPDIDDEDIDSDPSSQVIAAVDELIREQAGDILVFLPTERDIREVAKGLKAWNLHRDRPLEILPLYARLPAKEQNRVFAPHQKPRVVLATNVAESSLTVPGVRAVVDTGTARISRYSARSRVQRLPIESVSQASADQRKGRCGRIGPGICIRLYAEDDYLARDRFTTPEIRRSNLAAVILQTLALRLGAVEDFPFVDPPHPEAIRDGYKTLFELGAIDTDQRLTEMGRQLSRLPVDPRIGRIILAADGDRCLDDILIIAAALEVQDPRERPTDKRAAADEQHARFADPNSDFLAFLKMWDFYHHLKTTLSRNQLRRACRQNFLSHTRMREWADVYRQLRRIVDDSGRPIPPRSNDSDAIHRALLAGYLSGIAFRTDPYQYTGAGGAKFYLWPGSGLFSARPTWIVAAEQLETNKRYCRTVARIQPEWIEPIASHLIKKTHTDPHWDSRRMSPMVWQRVSLFGLPVVARRRVPLGPEDPESARQLFIQHGLVEAEVGERFGFLKHNLRVVQEIEELAARQRRGDWVIGQQAVYEFYDQHVPEHVYDAQRLRRWFRRAHRRNSQLLCMRREDLLDEGTSEPPAEQFPDTLPQSPSLLPLSYRFEPGDDQDGVTVTVPSLAINQLSRDQLDWLVPGRLEEKITALIRSLPKSVRRGLVPAPDTAREAARRLEFGAGSFLPELARVLQQISGEAVPVDAFQLDRLPAHLVMKVRVVDQQGETLAVEHDLDQIRQKYATHDAASTGQIEDQAWNQPPVLRWQFEDLPDEIVLQRGGIVVPAYPALVDFPEGIAPRLVDTRARADRLTRAAVRRLYGTAERQLLKNQVAWLPRLNESKLLATTMPCASSLESQLFELIADRAFLADAPLPRTEQHFQKRLGESEERISIAVQQVAKLLHPLLQSYHNAQLALEQMPSSRWPQIADDVSRQIKMLVPEKFLIDTPWQWLERFPCYFEAVKHRLEKLHHGSHTRDQQAVDEIEPWLDTYLQRAESHRQRGVEDPELVLFRWMLEELRISLFAQQLGTAVPVSFRRLEKQWAKVTG